MIIKRNKDNDLILYKNKSKEIVLNGFFHKMIEECQRYKNLSEDDFLRCMSMVLNKIGLAPSKLIKENYRLLTSPKVCVFSKELADVELTDEYKELSEAKNLLCQIDGKIESAKAEGKQIEDKEIIDNIMRGVVDFNNKNVKLYTRLKGFHTGCVDGYAYIKSNKKIKLMFFKLRHWGNPYGIIIKEK